VLDAKSVGLNCTIMSVIGVDTIEVGSSNIVVFITHTACHILMTASKGRSGLSKKIRRLAKLVAYESYAQGVNPHELSIHILQECIQFGLDRAWEEEDLVKLWGYKSKDFKKYLTRGSFYKLSKEI